MNVYRKAMDKRKRTTQGKVARLVLPSKSGLVPLNLLSR
jgi:hypothetical protein